MSIKSGKLDLLISRVEQWILESSTNLKYIKNPEGLLTSLNQLKNLVGNPRAKDSIAAQIIKIIKDKKKVGEGKIQPDAVMSNILLYGPPGTGKTLIGTKIARIMYNLGYLNDNPDSVKKATNITSSESVNINEIYPGPLLYFMVAALLMVIASFIWRVYAVLGFILTIIAIIFFVIAVGLICYYISNNEESEGTNVDPVTGDIDESSLIKIVSRDDFVGQYVGWSAPKTLKLLRSSIGKVLFIDEAYSLINGPQDQYGNEVLAEITRFASENPGKLVIIMAGYGDLMDEGVFSVQPGLRRRFLWQFDCEGYTSDELYSIFKGQIAKKGIKITGDSSCRDIFKNKHESFPNFGGDTKRLADIIEMKESSDLDSDLETITPDILHKYIIELESNNMAKKRKKQESTNPTAKLMNMLSNSFEPAYSTY